MSLRDEIKTLHGKKRTFFLLRVADTDAQAARSVVGVKTGTYNSWLQQEAFVALYRRVEEFSADYRQEAIQLLRRDNQLEAVLLEGKIIAKLKKEIDSEEYSLMRSHIAKEVYSRLITDLDIVPKSLSISFGQRIEQLNQNPPPELSQGDTVKGEFKEVKEDA